MSLETVARASCGHVHRPVGQDRLGFGPEPPGGWPRLYGVREATVAHPADEVLFGHETLTLEAGVHLRLDASDYSFAGPEFGPGVGWHRFAVLDGALAGQCVAVLVNDPLPPPDSLEAIG